MEAISVGAPAPQLGSIAVHDGRARVVAFVRGWAGDDDLDPLRALLRALGAELVVLATGGVWTLAPDDAIARAVSDRLAANVATIALLYGVPERDAVFVVDGAGMIRFARAYDDMPRLADAIRTAADAVLAPPAIPLTFTRRGFVASVAATGAAAALLPGCRSHDAEPAAPPREPTTGDLDVVLAINGQTHSLRIDPRASLLDTLRERLGLTGTKKGCDMGQCGACTVHLGGRRVLSCLTLAAMAQGQPITTIEGLAKGGELHPMQRAFVEHDALQCGFCTPGQIMSATAIEGDGDLREQMSGNICRCGAYPNIIAAVRAARKGA